MKLSDIKANPKYCRVIIDRMRKPDPNFNNQKKRTNNIEDGIQDKST